MTQKTGRTDEEAAPAAVLVARSSACAEAARRHVEARTAHLSASEKAARAREFNEKLVELIQAGRIQK